MTDVSFVRDLTLVLAVAFVGGVFAVKLKQPPLIGYILGGLTIGSYVLGIIKGTSIITTLADVGIAFLMFSIGLEFSFKRLMHVRLIAILGALFQMSVTILLGIIIFPFFGFSMYESLFLGALFSLSSTTVVVKVLGDKGELNTLPGEIMIGWLLVQDLAVLPMMILLPSLVHPGTELIQTLAIALVKVVVMLMIFIAVGRGIIPFLLAKTAATKNRELLLLSVLSLCLISAFATNALGLSFALGAFLAGTIISGSMERHVVFSEMRPLRDVFVIIFFVSLGMLIDPNILIQNVPLILTIMTGVMIIKFLIVFTTTLLFEYHSKTAFWVGMSLVQVGEFSFVLAKIGQESSLISNEIYQIILSVTLLSIFITPWLMQLTPAIYRLPLINNNLFKRFDKRQSMNEQQPEDHVIVCGYGRMGQEIVAALKIEKIPFMVIDYNHASVKELTAQGHFALYGDLTNIELLDTANLKKAKTVVIAVPDIFINGLILRHAKTANRQVVVICRAHHLEDEQKLYELGADSVIVPEFEASLSMLQKAFTSVGRNKDTAQEIMIKLRREHKKINGVLIHK